MLMPALMSALVLMLVLVLVLVVLVLMLSLLVLVLVLVLLVLLLLRRLPRLPLRLLLLRPLLWLFLLSRSTSGHHAHSTQDPVLVPCQLW